VSVVSGESRDSGAGAGRDPAELPCALGVPLGDELLQRALTHRSYAYENGGLPTNERLEFLGDSVLGLVVTDTLFRGYPNLPEGQLAKLRAAVVNMTALAGVARGLRLGAYVRLGRGEEGTGGRDKPSILADTLEAVIGAVYIDCGLDEASNLVHQLFDPVIERSARLGAGLDWKTSLQELTAAELLGVPEYQVEESGPDHQKSFRAVVKVGGQVRGTGVGRSKKAAEQQAAEAAWIAISANTAGNASAGDAAADARDAKAGRAADAARGADGRQPAGPAQDPDARRPQGSGHGAGPAQAEQAARRAPSGSAPVVPPDSGQRGRAGARVLREP
jgi:ribonuclease-3